MEENNGQCFRQVMIPVKDLRFFNDRFYFRFSNYASIENSSEPSSRSNEDIWNIDLVYLNLNRNYRDTHYPMLTFSGQRPSFLNRYQAMPYKQYRANPNSAMRESLHLDIANLDNEAHEAHYYYTVRQIGGDQHYTWTVDPVTVQPYQQSGYLECPPNGESPACPYVGALFAMSMAYDTVSYEIRHYVYDSTCIPPLVDSMVYRQGFYNYYAYDDGIPEMGYGVRPAGGKFAVRFELADFDTIQGAQLLFNHTLNDANNKYFDLVVWKDENGHPGEEVYRLSNQRPQWEEQLYRFHYYEFDKNVTLAGVFYIGIEQKNDALINIGFDASSDNSAYTFYNVNGSWQPTEKHGTLMIRPVVGKSYYIGIEEQMEARPNLRLYPNPASNTIHLEGDFENCQVSIYDLLGRKVYQDEYQDEISVSGLNSGLYLISIVTTEGLVINQKFLIEK